MWTHLKFHIAKIWRHGWVFVEQRQRQPEERLIRDIKLEIKKKIIKSRKLHIKKSSVSHIHSLLESTKLQIQDLLRPESCNMQIREGDNGVYVSGIEEVWKKILLLLLLLNGFTTTLLPASYRMNFNLRLIQRIGIRCWLLIDGHLSFGLYYVETGESILCWVGRWVSCWWGLGGYADSSEVCWGLHEAFDSWGPQPLLCFHKAGE